MAFQSGRTLVMEAVRGTRYAVASSFLDKAFESLDGANPDARAAIRLSFEAAESVFILLAPEQTRLAQNAGKTLKPFLDGIYGKRSNAAHRAAHQALDGFCDWVSALNQRTSSLVCRIS